MNYQVKQNDFETNSSSIHAIVISKESDVRLMIPQELKFNYGEFGWDFRLIKTVKGKASYLYTALFYVYKKSIDQWKTYLRFILDTLHEKGVKVEFKGDIQTQVLTLDVKNSVERPVLYFLNRLEFGYIDRGEDTKEFVDAVCTDKQLLLSYLFSENSFVKTGNNMSDQQVCIAGLSYPYISFFKENKNKNKSTNISLIGSF